MIKYLEHKSINKEKWDNCINTAFNGNIFGFSWYLDIVSPGWTALVEGDYTAVMPLPLKKKAGVDLVTQPPFIKQLGVFSVDKLSEEKANEFLSAVPGNLHIQELHLNTFNRAATQYIESYQKSTYELDLIGSYEVIESGYSESCRKDLAKATFNKLEIAHIINPDPILLLEQNGKEKQALTGKDKLLKKVLDACIHKGKGQIWEITFNGEVCAGAAFIESNSKVILLFTSVNEIGKEMGALTFLIDSFIKHNTQRNLTLDFNSAENVFVPHLYKSFGAKQCFYLSVSHSKLQATTESLQNKGL